jgi:hypothetical protein
VPGCKNRAALVFGMVCAEHKSIPKRQIESTETPDARRRRPPLRRCSVEETADHLLGAPNDVCDTQGACVSCPTTCWLGLPDTCSNVQANSPC